MTLSSLPLLPTRNLIVMPGASAPIEIGRPTSVELVDAVREHSPALLLLAPLLADGTDPETLPAEGAALSDLSQVAVVAEITTSVARGGKRSIVVRGLRRVRLVQKLGDTGFLTASFEELVEMPSNADPLARGLAMAIRDRARTIVQTVSGIPADLRSLVTDGKIAPSELADRLSVYLEFSFAERLQLLGEINLVTRLERVLQRLVEQSTKVEVEMQLREKVDTNIQKTQKEMMLRQKKRALEDELAEVEAETATETPDSDEELAKRIEAAGLPESVMTMAKKQLKRLETLPSESPETGIVRTYLDWIAALPWSTRSEEQLDVKAAREILDADHYGQDRIKRRLIEFIAVRKLAALSGRRGRAPLLCFVGPPGVGKTSLGRSVARALGRKFVRMSLGGVRDEAEIRGHRRTYVGSLPGRILSSLRRAGTRNPVMLLDEIDKLASDMRGDPEAALLEVLDPEQNHEFTDHYLEVPFDLSEVLFIATANDLSRLSPPLRDRLEVIELPGYTRKEKLEIAKQYLLPKQITEHGLDGTKLQIADDVIDHVIGGYTREAGVRRLEEKLASLVRAASVEFAEGRTEPKRVTRPEVQLLLGPAPIDEDQPEERLAPGQIFGLAWSPSGGSVMNVEVTQMPGKGSLQLTGQLGDVMKESVQAALSYVRSRLPALGIAVDPLAKHDLHVHLPAGAVQKDGPSGGVAITAALVSLFTGREPRPKTAATGEISLRGAVLPIGGVKEKLLAAHRAGMNRVVLPERNRKDIAEVPAEVREGMELVFVSRLEDALAAMLEPAQQTVQLAA